jgi:hypothetical protein
MNRGREAPGDQYEHNVLPCGARTMLIGINYHVAGDTEVPVGLERSWQ